MKNEQPHDGRTSIRDVIVMLKWRHRVASQRIQDFLEVFINEVLSTALAKNHAKPAKGDTSHVTKMNIFCFSQLIMS